MRMESEWNVPMQCWDVLYKRFLWAAEKKAPGIVALKIPENRTQLKHSEHLLKNFTKNCTKFSAELQRWLVVILFAMYRDSHELIRFCK